MAQVKFKIDENWDGIVIHNTVPYKAGGVVLVIILIPSILKKLKRSKRSKNGKKKQK